MNTFVPLTMHDSIPWICSVYISDVLLVRNMQRCHNSQIKRLCYLIQFSVITHNKEPAVFEDKVSTHKWSEKYSQQESRLAIVRKNEKDDRSLIQRENIV